MVDDKEVSMLSTIGALNALEGHGRARRLTEP